MKNDQRASEKMEIDLKGFPLFPVFHLRCLVNCVEGARAVQGQRPTQYSHYTRVIVVSLLR